MIPDPVLMQQGSDVMAFQALFPLLRFCSTRQCESPRALTWKYLMAFYNTFAFEYLS
jgi:hypothetical protein